MALAAAMPKTLKPLYTEPLLHESDTTLEALPEIEHVMRAPDARPSSIVSLLFTLLALAPMAGFILYLTNYLSITIKFPSALKTFWSFTFLGCLAMVLFLFVLFWIYLTMYETLKCLSVLSLVTCFVGHKALQGDDPFAAPKTMKSKKTE